MSGKLFTFDPAAHKAAFQKEGFVHIKNGTNAEFLKKAIEQVAENMKSKLMKEFAIGDKQQAMYEFPHDADYIGELKRTVAALCGFQADEMVVSERHIKGYEANADPNPHAHKDRFASEISVGISIHVREGSTLVLYPYDLTDVNPFNASTLLRASLSPDRYPEPSLKKSRAIEILDSAGDVIVFRGHSFWHLRRNPANTTMLYLKVNSLNCDPLGEDPETAAVRKNTEAALSLDDAKLAAMKPLVGRRVDYVHRMCNRNWQEVTGVVLWGDKHFTIDDDELAIMKASDGRKPLSAVLASMAGGAASNGALLAKVRRIASKGVIDLKG